LKNKISSYQFLNKFAIALTLLILAMTSAPVLYSQEDTSGELDAPVVDSLSQLNNYENVEEDQYNYYDHLLYWPADSLIIRKVPDSAVAALKARDEFWYADRDFRKKSVEPSRPVRLNWLSSEWFRALVWTVIIGGFAAVLIWFLVNSNVRLFSKRAKALQNDDQIPENIFEINYNEEISKAIRESNYRLAVRLQFLRLLKSLAEKKAIQYKEDATNFDYILQLRNSAYYNGFFKVTRYYEYAWYGGFAINEELYSTIKRDFDSLDTQLIKY
jgi:hypothetical protein